MSVRAKVKEITKNMKGTSRAGKEYTYTKFVYTTETGDEKVKQLFKDDLISGITVGDTVDITFKKNEKGYFDMISVDKGYFDMKSNDKAKTSKAGGTMTDKDIEIEVMNALNVASSVCEAGCSVEHVVKHAKAILASKSELVSYAKSVRNGEKEVSDDPFEGIN